MRSDHCTRDASKVHLDSFLVSVNRKQSAFGLAEIAETGNQF